MTSFRTNRGRCIIDNENLYISSSWSGQFRRYLEGGVFGKIMIASLLTLPFIILVNLSISSGPVLTGFAVGAGLAALMLGTWFTANKLRGFSYDRVIPRDKIESFKAVEGTEGLSKPRFIVKFEKNGEDRKRYIVMPSKFLSYGEEEFEKAQELLKEEGFELEK